MEGTETDSIKMICEVSKAGAEVTWYHGEEELPEVGRYEQITDGRKRILIIKGLKMEDAGSYNCRLSPDVKTSAELKVNGKRSRSGDASAFNFCSFCLFHLCFIVCFNVNVGQQAPLVCFPELAAEFISKPKNQEVVEGQAAEFTCSVSKETHEVKWFRGGQELETGDKFTIVSEGKRRVLVVKTCELRDEGAYVAHIGAIKASADLVVTGKSLCQLLDLEIPEHIFMSPAASRKTEDHHTN